MKLIPRRSVIHNLFNRRRATTLSSFITGVNLFLGVFVLIFIVVVQESRHKKTASYSFETNMEYVQINSDSQSIKAMAKQSWKTRSLNDYYFRIDYTIQKGMCQPVNVFYTKTAIQAIRTATLQELNEVLSRRHKVHLNILRINGILKSSERTTETSSNKTEKLVCGYILELFVVLNFPSSCDDDCQRTQLKKITSNKNLFGDLPNSSFKFTLPDISLIDTPATFHVYDFNIYRSTKYLEKALFIQSVAEPRFISTKYFHSNVNQSLVSMSVKDKSLFIMKQGLETLDSSSVYVSFLSLSIPNLYLRHEGGKIKIAKYDQTNAFRQSATFKIIFDNRNDIVALQTINLSKQLFIALSKDQEPALILLPLEEESTVEEFDARFIFKLITAS